VSNFVGMDAFSYRACDPSGACDAATVTIEVRGIGKPGWLTGGGWLGTAGGKSHDQVQLGCTAADGGTLRINAPAGPFRLEHVDFALCVDDPGLAPGGPKAGWEIHRRSGTGSFDGASGYTIEWTLTDEGEPGRSDGWSVIVRDPSGMVVLKEASSLDGGQPPGARPLTHARMSARGAHAHPGHRRTLASGPVAGQPRRAGLPPAWHADVVPIDVALLGCGHPHVPDVLGVLASEPDLRLVAVWDADPSAIPVALSGAAVSRVATAIGRAHAVVICAPTDERPALCVQAARAGRPILVEKPVARTAGEARDVAREVARSRTPAVAALFLRELPAIGRLRGVLRERLVGRLASVSAALTHSGAIDRWFEGPCAWMRDPRRAGVGAFGDLALHLVDALAALSADESPRLAAVALDRGATGQGDLGGVALGTWAGVPLTVRASWTTRPGAWSSSCAAPRAPPPSATACSSCSATGAWSAGSAPPPDAGEALRAFAARLRARRFPRDGLAPAVHAQEQLEAAVRVA
jgi:predicted dehydrogenase